MKQIPRKYLPDDMTVKSLNRESEYGGEYLAPVEIKNVRFERVENLNPNAYQLAEGASGRIWIDAVNSTGVFEVEKNSLVKVTRVEDEMIVLACMPYETTNGKIHHWELDVK